MRKKMLPAFASDEEAEEFVASADLTEYDLSGGVPTRYVILDQASDVSVPVPRRLLDAVKRAAEREGVSDSRFIEKALERALRDPRPENLL